MALRIVEKEGLCLLDGCPLSTPRTWVLEGFKEVSSFLEQVCLYFVK